MRASADTALGARIDALGSASGKNVGTASGQVPILGAGGKLPNSVIPAIALSEYLGEVDAQSGLTELAGQAGDYAVVKGSTSTSGTWIIHTGTGSDLSDWVHISGPTDITAGDGISVSGSTVGLSASGATAGSYGGASAIPVVTVDQYGRVTKASTVAPADQRPTAGTGISVSGRQVSLASSGVTAGSRGSATQIPTVTVDQYGRVTALGGATVYPPTTAGTSGQVWRSDGSGAGAWETPDTAPTASSSRLVTSGAVKTAIDAEASARASAISSLQGTVSGKAAKTEALGTGTALALGGGTGARTLTLTHKTVSGTTSTSAVTIPVASSTASGLMTAVQAVRLDAALPASTPKVYVATIPQTDYLDVCLAQYVRIGLDKGLLSLSGHVRDISLPNDAWTLISIDTIMSAMGLTHKRPSAYRATGWWHYDDGDDHGERYGSGAVCQVSPSGGLELGRFYSGTQIGSWEMSNIGRDRYISVRDVYVEIQ